MNAAPTSDELLADVSRMLSAFNYAMAIMDAERESLLWCSPECARVHPMMVTGNQIAQVPGLKQALTSVTMGQAFTSASLDLKLPVDSLSMAEQSPSHSSDKTTPSVVFRVELNRLDNGHIAMRINRDTDNDTYLRRYMADREKLFTTSRSISVSEMATTLAHELNQPIGTIANMLRGVQLRLGKRGGIGDDINSALGKALDQTRFAANIISRIREFTQSRQPNFSEHDIEDLVRESVALLDWVFESEQVSVQVLNSDAALLVRGDQTMLHQVFTNLCRNAVDAMRDSANAPRVLDISIEPTEDGVKIEFADSGHGLDEQAEESLFTPFVTRKASGMGVGLNICRSFIELHQGRLWLAQNETGGCTAHVLLPHQEPIHSTGPVVSKEGAS